MQRRQPNEAHLVSTELLAALALPDPGDRLRQRLMASIAQEGLLESIVVSSGPACPGEIADGRVRAQICHQLGADCPRRERPFESELDFCLYRYVVNVERRELTPAQRIRLGMALEPHQRQLAAARKAQAVGAGRGVKSLLVGLPEEKGASRDQVGQLIGLGGSSYERGANVYRHGSPELVHAFEQGRETINSAHRRLQAEQRSTEKLRLAAQLNDDPPPLPGGRFQVLVIDSPSPEEGVPYPTMTLEEIAALPIPGLLAEDAIVWLWTTSRFQYEAEQIARDVWGLEHRNTLTWAKTDRHGKPRLGTGHWLRGQTEPCLLYMHGQPLFINGNHSTLLAAPARQHSRKPDAFYTLVEDTCPGAKLELFARQHRPGWTAWGGAKQTSSTPARRRRERPARHPDRQRQVHAHCRAQPRPTRPTRPTRRQHP